MPFIGRDWRSPGEAWVKTESLGWQRMKIIESQLHIPSSCHQNPACSWPPRSEFGKHMEKNCNKGSPQFTRNKHNLSSFNGSLSSENSSDGSASSSPTGSPEKINGHKIVASNYPIIIASPYGTQYSCCAHHHCQRPLRATCSTGQHQTNCDLDRSQPSIVLSSHNRNAQSESRSLSTEMINTPNNNHSMLKYNRSISDFRPASACEATSPSVELPGKSPDRMSGSSSPGRCASISPPILMRNGKILDYVSGTASYDEESDSQSPKNLDNLQTTDGHTELMDNNNGCCCNGKVCNQRALHSQNRTSPNQAQAASVKNAPHCRISVRTREVAMYNTISEAFYRLDFCNAIHDIRRFNYICKLLHLLITQNLTSLSGCATRVLFNMLEQVAWEVSSNKRNIHVLRNLLDELRQIIRNYYCWGRPIGSSVLWQQHFDTIERISQIVDGIELSPPNDGARQIRFDNLPVEMIREILLRLNDYRDLVNSAQASPVMRTMIDSQIIWKRLCRYHFTEQQLRIAFNNNRDIPLVGKGSKRAGGTKYARIASANGKGSYRSPVEPADQKSSGSSVPSSKIPLTTRQQIDLTSQRRNPSRLRTEDCKRVDEFESSEPSSSTSSHVTNTIRIFNNEGQAVSSMERRSSQGTVIDGNITNTNNESVKPNADGSGKRGAHTKMDEKTPTFTGNRSSGGQEIDWERVFHQLRKKFDLKEEYADCLLFCRQCRCLFWKSFGHPCILEDDDDYNRNTNHRRPTCSPNCDCQGIVDDQQLNIDSSQGKSRNGPSVALLSRNFDNRAQGGPANENMVLQRQASRPSPSDNLVPLDRQRAPRPSSIDNARHPLHELNARFVNENNQSPQRPARVLQNSANNNNNRNNNNGSRSSRRGEELVPKHVTISPQAFLKFFSL